MAELYMPISPYNYALNNPVSNMDRMGLDVVNAHKGDLEKSKKEADDAKSARAALGKDASRQEIRNADSNVQKTQASLDEQQRLFDGAQAIIDDLKNNHKAFFAVLDNLTDAAGDEIDVSYGVEDNLFLSTGATGITYYGMDKFTDSKNIPVPVVKTLADGSQVFTIKGGKSGKLNQIDIVIDSKYATPGVASHEGGHAEYFAKFITSYMNWVWDLQDQGIDMSHHNSHRYNDPSGINADKRTEEYKTLNPQK